MDKTISSKELIQMYMYPLKTLNLPSTKNLIPSNSAEEIDATSKSLKLLKEFLSVPRLDRKNNRSEAVWMPEKHLSKLTRRAGTTLSHFGFTENGETYLTPEETLYLIETNYLEVLWNGVPFSIEQAYTVLITCKENLEKYRSFKELAILGYRIKEPGKSGKRKHCENSSETENKRSKSDVNSSDEELFEKLKQEGPKSANISECYSTAFNVYLPKNTVKNSDPDFEIIQQPGKEFSLQCVSGKKSSTVTSFAGTESFYQLHEVDLENK